MNDFEQKTQDCIIKELRNQVKQLKQENSDLKHIEIAKLKASIDEKNEIICDLKEENKELKKDNIIKYEYLIEAQKNQIDRLIKFVNILKRTYIQIDLLGELSINRFHNNVKIGEHATENEIKLITEVLCNERNSNK